MLVCIRDRPINLKTILTDFEDFKPHKFYRYLPILNLTNIDFAFSARSAQQLPKAHFELKMGGKFGLIQRMLGH